MKCPPCAAVLEEIVQARFGPFFPEASRMSATVLHFEWGGRAILERVHGCQPDRAREAAQK